MSYSAFWWQIFPRMQEYSKNGAVYSFTNNYNNKVMAVGDKIAKLDEYKAALKNRKKLPLPHLSEAGVITYCYDLVSRAINGEIFSHNHIQRQHRVLPRCGGADCI